MDSELENIMDKIMKEKREERDQLIIDAIIDIYNQKYDNYDTYFKEIQEINDDLYERYKDRLIFCKDYLPIFEEKAFNYIKLRGREKVAKDYMARETIRILRKKCILNIDPRLATEEEKEILHATLRGDENV